MSGYWSFRGCAEPIRPSLLPEIEATSADALASLPAAFDLLEGDAGVLTSCRSTFACAVEREEPHFDTDSAAEKGTELGIPNATVFDITQSPREASSLDGNRGPEEDAEGKHTPSETPNPQRRTPLFPTTDFPDAVDSVMCDIQRAWWQTNLGVDMNPIDVSTITAEAMKRQPQAPTDETMPHHSARSKSNPVDSEDTERLRACARELLGSMTPTAASGKPTPHRHSEKRKTATAPRAPTLHTARIAARREVAKESKGSVGPPIPTPPNSDAAIPEEPRVSLPADLPHSQPALLRRMGEQTAERCAAHMTRQRHGKNQGQEQDPAQAVMASSETNTAVKKPCRGAWQASVEREGTRGPSGAYQGDSAGKSKAEVPASHVSSSGFPLNAYFAELIMVMLSCKSDVGAVNAVNNRDLKALRLQWQRELGQVATHYHACRQTYKVLRTWRAKATTSARQKHLAATQCAHFALVVQELCVCEAAERASSIVQAERDERSLVAESFRRETAYQLTCLRRQRQELVELRWHFVKWVSLVEDVRAERQTRVYRAHLLHCAQEALRELHTSNT